MKIVNNSDLDDIFFSYQEIPEISAVQDILNDIKTNGDSAVKKYTANYDHVEISELKIDIAEIKNAYRQVDRSVIKTFEDASRNIRRFAEEQFSQVKDFEFEIQPGVITGQKTIPLHRAGVYVPAGNFPLPSTVLMCAIPAKVAGVDEVILFSPPRTNSSIHPAILVAADIAGIDEMYKVGGIQAIAAMAYGTESIKPVDKIVGPGNKYVTAAKKLVYGAVGIDFIAGPTEIMIIADDSANPEYIAADLLAQAEHDVNASPILVTDSKILAEKVLEHVQSQLENLSTAAIAEESVKNNGIIILVDNLNQSIDIANKKAPEHLEIQVRNENIWIPKLRNYGSLFIGEYSVEAMGDYNCGLNHTLPTNRCARYTGGLSVKDFFKIQTTLRVDKEGVNSIGAGAKHMGEIEGLAGHANSVDIRIKDLNGQGN